MSETPPAAKNPERTFSRDQLREIAGGLGRQEIREMADILRRTLFPIENGFQTIDGVQISLHQPWRNEKWVVWGNPLERFIPSGSPWVLLNGDYQDLHQGIEDRGQAMARLREALTAWGFILRDE